ncbi:MAG: hypothetical protein AAF637_08375 [Pseudomonadota bacterium]
MKVCGTLPSTQRVKKQNEGAWPLMIEVRRLLDAPIIRAHMDGRMGANINGPSLIRVPAWVQAPLGRFYLYFADHRGTYIRLAYADEVTGPWRMHEPGVLDLDESRFPVRHPGGPEHYAHIASPDLHVETDAGRLRMYFHGRHEGATQLSRVALSEDGLSFEVLPELLGPSYFRVFRHQGWWYALAMPGTFRRSKDGLVGFEEGPDLGDPDMRHVALTVRGDVLHLFWTRAGDAPEQILHSTIDIAGDWRGWRLEGTRPVLRPERSWEGAALPIFPSKRGAIYGPVHQLRDPCLFEDGGRVYLLYSSAGEQAIGLAEVSGL